MMRFSLHSKVRDSITVALAFLFSSAVPGQTKPQTADQTVKATQLLQTAYTALGGASGWAGHTSSHVEGISTSNGTETYIEWDYDWSGQEFRSRLTSTLPSGGRTMVIGSATMPTITSPTETRSLTTKHPVGYMPIHLPGVLLAKDIAESDSILTVIPGCDHDFAADPCVSVTNHHRTESHELWVLNASTGLPDRWTHDSGEHIKPNKPLTVVVTYRHYALLDGRTLVTQLQQTAGPRTDVISLSKYTFDAAFPLPS